MVYIHTCICVRFGHDVISWRLTRDASVEDAAKQAFMEYRDKHFSSFEWKEDHIFLTARVDSLFAE